MIEAPYWRRMQQSYRNHAVRLNVSENYLQLADHLCEAAREEVLGAPRLVAHKFTVRELIEGGFVFSGGGKQLPAQGHD